MKKIDSLAANYWIDNTQSIYDQYDTMHVSYFVLEAYKAGFRQARRMAAQVPHLDDCFWEEISKIGEEDAE